MSKENEIIQVSIFKLKGNRKIYLARLLIEEHDRLGTYPIHQQETIRFGFPGYKGKNYCN